MVCKRGSRRRGDVLADSREDTPSAAGPRQLQKLTRPAGGAGYLENVPQRRLVESGEGGRTARVGLAQLERTPARSEPYRTYHIGKVSGGYILSYAMGGVAAIGPLWIETIRPAIRTRWSSTKTKLGSQDRRRGNPHGHGGGYP